MMKLLRYCDALAWLHAHGEVLDRTEPEPGEALVTVSVRMAPGDHERFLRQFG